MSAYSQLNSESEQLYDGTKQNTVSLKWFGLIAVACVGGAGVISYLRFSQPGAKADFIESDVSTTENPRFRYHDLTKQPDGEAYEVEDLIRISSSTIAEELTTTTMEATTETHSYTVTTGEPDNATENMNVEQVNSNDVVEVPSYMLGYGASFVYNQPTENAVPNDSYQASTYMEESAAESDESVNTGYVDSGSGDVNYGSGDVYSTPATTPSTSYPTTLRRNVPLSCWRCSGARSWIECAQNGQLDHCQESATSCQIEVRRRDGIIESINTGCKQRQACENNKAQNFPGGEENPTANQCRPDVNTEGPSVCRQCCYANNCNYNLDFFNTDGWSQLLH